jgi:membrane protein
MSFYELWKGNYTYTASALAFTTLVSIIPLLAVMLYVFSFSAYFSELVRNIQNYVVSNYLPGSMGTLNKQIQIFIKNAASVSFISAVFLLFSAYSLFTTIRCALNQIWEHSKPIAVKKNISILRYWITLIVMAIIFGLNILIGSYLFSLPVVLNFLNKYGLTSFILHIVSIIMNTLMFAWLYIFIPKYRLRYGDGFAGAFLAALIFEIAKVGFGFYINTFSNYGVVFGTIAIFPIFLFWVYMSWLIILFGAVFAEEKLKYK